MAMLVVRCWNPDCRHHNGVKSLEQAKGRNKRGGCVKCGQPLKNSDGRQNWGVRYKVKEGGKLKTKREYCPDRGKGRVWELKDAKDRLREIEDAQAKGESTQKPDIKTTFRDLSEWYLTLTKVKDKRSYSRDMRSIGKLNEFFGDYLLKDILPATVEDYIHKRQNEPSYRGHLTKPATINRELACMKTIFNKAIDNNKAQRSPFRRGMMLKENNARKRKLTMEEFPRLIAECPGYIEPVVKLAFYTGMRRGEILKLTWGMVDLKRKCIDLPPEVCKTNEGRFVPLNPEMVEMFRAMPRGLSPDMPVFMRRGKPITGSTIRVGLEIACKRAGIEGLTFHDLRRTAKSNMLSVGVDEVHRDIILGHSLKGMDVHYMVSSEDELHEAMARYTEWVQNKLEVTRKVTRSQLGGR